MEKMSCVAYFAIENHSLIKPINRLLPLYITQNANDLSGFLASSVLPFL